MTTIPMNLDNHLILTCSNDIDAIIAPLKQFFCITSFVYQKNFHDGSETRLSNQPAWLKYFFEKKLYQHSVFERDTKKFQQSKFLWVNLPQHHQVLSQAREFNIDHGLTFVYPQEDGCEFFFLGTTPDKPEIMQLYLSHMDLLEQFLVYFRERAASLIAKSHEQRIFIPEKISLLKNELHMPEFNRESFQKLLISPKLATLSPRELECLVLLQDGYTYKMIGNELDISARTVETYIEQIKQKTNSYSKADLLKLKR
jgi:DNA-binding CsgD family transcriptional regulator